MKPGTRVNHYEIASSIGKGGMGEVWKARDTKLGRDVAIKTLPEEFAQSADRLARFEREARLLATLNHPNIAAIYGLEEAGGIRFLVLELVEGETLADRLQRGAIPLDESLKLALQIADALEVAHEKGVVHRDLKPANIKVTFDDRIKVLDFGLAKALGSDDGSANLSNSPTVMATQASPYGLILGTAGYMSPEQARGQRVDKRADIWAFGVVLYEMLTGKRLFEGATVSDTLAAVLTKEPDLSETPARVRKLLRACLERDPKRRLRDIGEAWRLLEDDSPAASPVKARRAFLPWITAAVFAVMTALAAWAPWRSEPVRSLTRLDKDLLSAEVPMPFHISNAIISPDGTHLLYLTTDSAGRGRGGRGFAGTGSPGPIFIRRLDQPKAGTVELRGTDGAQRAGFSPDGHSIVFFGSRQINKVSVEGGSVTPVANIIGAAGVLWADDGTIFASGVEGLWRIPPGGKPVLVKVKDDPVNLGIQQILPDGKTLLAVNSRDGLSSRGSNEGNNQVIEAVSLIDGTRKIIGDGVSPRYLPTGHLIYSRQGTLFLVPFDPDKPTTNGNPVPIVDDIFATRNISVSLSRNGTLVYVTGERDARQEGPSSVVDWIDGPEKRSPLISKPGMYQRPRFSPDGSQLAIGISEPGNPHESVFDLKTQHFTQITFGSGATTAVWTGGGYLIFGTDRNVIRWATSDGAEPPRELLKFSGIGLAFVTSFSHGRLAYFVVGGGAPGGIRAGSKIMTVPVTETNGQLTPGTPEPLLNSDFTEQHPEFSTDGRWIAYVTNKSSRPEVYVRAFPPPASGRAREVQISDNGGSNPHWSDNKLLYVSGDQILSMSYTVNGDTFVPGKTQVSVQKLGGTTADNWDVAPNGRIAVVTTIETQTQTQPPAVDRTVVFLVNFYDQLRRKR